MGKASVLLVEDNVADQRLIAEGFREAKSEAEITVVNDGVEALRFLKKEGKFQSAAAPDLIILDLNLPRKDGRELLAEIKMSPDLKQIPVIVFTTSNASVDITQSYGLHANCFINKPIHLEQFLQVIASINCFWLKTTELPRRA